jgi:hypothetical protein
MQRRTNRSMVEWRMLSSDTRHTDPKRDRRRGGFVNAHDQQHRCKGRNQHGGRIDQSRRSLPFTARRIKIKGRCAPDVRHPTRESFCLGG